MHWYALGTSKKIIVVFVTKTNTGYVGGFLQVQHYWGVNISHELLYQGLWKLRTIHWSHHVPTTKLTPFMVSEDEGDTKEGPGKSMKNVYSGTAKGTSRAETMPNSEKIKSVALAIVELCESEGFSQAVS